MIYGAELYLLLCYKRETCENVINERYIVQYSRKKNKKT